MADLSARLENLDEKVKQKLHKELKVEIKRKNNDGGQSLSKIKE